MLKHVIIGIFILATISLPVSAEDKTVALKAAVVSVSGIAQQRSAADPKGKWRPIKAGDVLDELTIIRTGLGSRVVLGFSDRGQTVIRSATKVGIKEFSRRGRHVKTRLGLKYGSMRAKVDSTRGTNDFKVRTPVATLSVRGTSGRLGFSGDFGLHLHGTTGTWNVKNKAGRARNVIAGERTTGKLTKSIKLAAARRGVKMGDPNGGTRGKEAKNLQKFGGGLGIIGFAGAGPRGARLSWLKKRLILVNNNNTGGTGLK